jgi:23S rRNA pseudouridine2605 synthase
MERLQKFLAKAGVASRRAAEKMIVEGRVKLNGKVVTEMGTKVEGKDLVVVDGKPVTAITMRRWCIMYKPPSVVTTMSDPQGRQTVADFTAKLGGRLFPVGRLDYDAEGALLLTDDGDLANKLMHPKHQVQRVYLAKVKGVPQAPSLEKLREGVRLEDGPAKAHEVSIYELADKNTWIKIVVTEGRQHLVKRLCAAIGHPVLRLFRPAHAGIGLQGLRPGDVRPLSGQEVELIRAISEGKQAPAVQLKLPARRHGHGPGSGEVEAADETENAAKPKVSPTDSKHLRERSGKAPGDFQGKKTTFGSKNQTDGAPKYASSKRPDSTRPDSKRLESSRPKSFASDAARTDLKRPEAFRSKSFSSDSTRPDSKRAPRPAFTSKPGSYAGENRSKSDPSRKSPRPPRSR